MGTGDSIVIARFFLASCASVPKIQPKVDALVNTGQYGKALETLNDNTALYGKNNELLYLLDKGYIQHLNRDFSASIATFDAAKQKIDQLYTKSLSAIAATWAINDYASAYRGEDFERVFINIFQAINYVLLGKYEDALVEARDVDSTLNSINSQYKEGQKNVYKEDAFVRLLMGIIYELGNSREDINDAYISYKKAVEIYEQDYAENYGLAVPGVLKENILTAARFMGMPDFNQYRSRYPDSQFFSSEEKKKKAEVYLIHYNGLSPVKSEETLTVPTLEGHVLKVAFPIYRSRIYGINASRLLAKNAAGKIFGASTDLVQDIGAIARKDLERKKLRFIAKSAMRTTGKFLVLKNQEKSIKKNQGGAAADWFQFFGTLYSLISERADLRSWQTLPDQIRMARLILEPGEYECKLENFNESGSNSGEFDFKKILLLPGQKIFLFIQTNR